MVPRDADVLIHIEGDDVAEGYLTSLVASDQLSVGAERGPAGGETEDEGAILRGGKGADALDDVIGGPLGHSHLVLLYNYSHKVMRMCW